jgi:hypothetical protein
LAKHSLPIFPQTSLHLTSTLLTFYIPSTNTTLKGRRFQTVGDIITDVNNDFKVIPQTSFQQKFQKWKRQWERHIAAQGDYFEVDNIQ